jgi:hypothetical protein
LIKDWWCDAVKKNILIVSIVILLLIVGGIFISRNKPDDTSPNNITSLKYSFGSFTGGYYDYEIYQDNNQYIFVATGGNGVDLDINETIDQSVLDDIQEIIQRYKVKKWNGFNKSDDDILDGHSFSLFIGYGDYEIKAEGYMKYPRKYMDFQNEMQAYFDSLITSLQD